ncbi:hypothetical protein PDIG_57010 [Penicillium digitatum PHI26]|uniref:Zn(2)-C6 fungal-type domain-containing protein n=2 Tax=Penicillium digitatum TaxID=36651 RepID=K9FPZ6_PEND2|nr:hypothetical protein PDIP_66560 [Penicillium digitatum Pd1]EKV09145.1 hypothetical protein PDIP_66560 [Penicillium digitatum Pd1]EKV10412.1 hypothetical protein PDIG_57010 [Penicillium digitatum PHI26]
MGPRRSHRKSRNGCPQCKARRIKCDEQCPCTNCTKHAIHCSYVDSGMSNSTHTRYTQSESLEPSYVPSTLNVEYYPATPAGNFDVHNVRGVCGVREDRRKDDPLDCR